MALITCPECNKEVSDTNKKCPHCGYKLNVNKQKKGISKKIIGIIGICAIVIICFIGILIYTRPINKFHRYISKKNYDAALQLAQEKLPDSDEITKIIDTQADDIFNQFLAKKMDYDKAKAEITKLKAFKVNIKKFDDYLSKMNNLHLSRDSFQIAQDNESKKDYMNAIKQYKKVIEDDTDNYNIAQDKIGELTSKLKDQALKDASAAAKKHEYVKAMNILSDVITITGSDEKVKSVKSKYYEQNEKYQLKQAKLKMKRLKKKQKVYVVDGSARKNIRASGNEKILYPDMLEALVKNNCKKTVKNYEISFLAWDKNKYPVIIYMKYDHDGDYEQICTGDNVNQCHLVSVLTAYMITYGQRTHKIFIKLSFWLSFW